MRDGGWPTVATGSAPCWRSCSKFNRRQFISQLQIVNLLNYHYSPPLFHGMYRHDRCDLLLHCHYVFLLEKPKWPSPNHFHLLLRVFGISSQVIFHPFPLFLLSGRNSSTILFEVPFPVIPHHPLASRFVTSAHPQMRLRSDTPHRLANTFQLSAYD